MVFWHFCQCVLGRKSFIERSRAGRGLPRRAGKGMAKLGKFFKNMVVVACLAACVWCAGGWVQQWAQEQGGDALLFAAGMQAQEGPAAASPSPAPSPGAGGDPRAAITTLHGEGEPFLPDGGVVPFHSDLLPGAAATPEPGRGTGPVEEIRLEGGQQVGNFFVKDTTGSGTDLAAELLEDPAVHLKGDGSVEVLLYHTHTSEAYMEEHLGFYYTDMQTRTQNQDMGVVAVGEELKKALEAQGIGVVHDTTVNDTQFNGSYARSWEVLQNNLAQYPTIQVTIDLHRDSMTTQEGVKYKPTAAVNGRKAAQFMIVAGCDADGGWGDFPDWRENLRLALRVQQSAAGLYPELARPLNFSNNKYNMNATKGSLLIEVGTEVSTVSEARYTGRLLGDILADALLPPAQALDS